MISILANSSRNSCILLNNTITFAKRNLHKAITTNFKPLRSSNSRTIALAVPRPPCGSTLGIITSRALMLTTTNSNYNFPSSMKPILRNITTLQNNNNFNFDTITVSLPINSTKPTISSFSYSSSTSSSLLQSHLPTPLNKTTTSVALQKRTLATKKHKRIIKMAKGYRGRANRTFKAAIRRVEKGLQYAYRDRKVKKRNFRKLWITRVNAGVRQHGISYSTFINEMSRIGSREDVELNGQDEGIILNRKVLAELASNEPFSFKAVVDVVKMKSEGKKNMIKNE